MIVVRVSVSTRDKVDRRIERARAIIGRATAPTHAAIDRGIERTRGKAGGRIARVGERVWQEVAQIESRIAASVRNNVWVVETRYAISLETITLATISTETTPTRRVGA